MALNTGQYVKQFTVVTAIGGQFLLDNYLKVSIHRQLTVVALLKTLSGFHDGTLRVGKMTLCAVFGHSKAPLIRRTTATR